MKNKIMFLFSPSLLLASCGLFFDDTALLDKQVTLYDIDQYSSNLEDAKRGNYTLKVEEGKELLYYCDLETYARMMETSFDSSVTSKFSYSGENPVWQVYHNDDYIFYCIVSHASKAIYYGGSLYYALPSNIETEKTSSYMLDCTYRVDVIEAGESSQVFSYSNMNATSHRKDNKVYVPLSVFDAVLGQTCSLFHFNNVGSLYRYSSFDSLTKKDNAESFLVKATMDYYSEHGIPDYLAKQEYDIAVALLENRYGLKKEKGISSFATYFNKMGILALMSNSNPEKRMEGLSSGFASLNDMHTRLLSPAFAYGETGKGYVKSHLEQEREATSNTLKTLRNAHFEEAQIDVNAIEYSNDGKVALFRFDGFNGDDEAVDKDGNRKEDLYKTDTYFYVLKQLKEISAHGGVEKVVLDLSLNGGGYVIIMQKILALLGNLTAVNYSASDIRGYLRKSTVHLNVDAVGEEELFSSRFNFYILTGPNSFSAGNALPCYARHQGLAKTIGVNSGGGECTVETAFLPLGHRVCFSTDSRMVDYDGKEIYHVEGGAGVDYPLDYINFYNIEKIAETISQQG